MSSVYSVKQLNHYIHNMVEGDMLLSRISVRGEISNLKDHPSGHLYFSLKEEGATLSVIMFAGYRRTGLKTNLSNGQKVVIEGSVDYYEVGGTISLHAYTIEDDGLGELNQRYLKLKKQLEEEGMFDAGYKKPIPKYARSIGIITSRSGAALQDIIRVTHERNPYVNLYLYPAIVQGENAAPSIVSGIQYMDPLGFDILIIGRGGGSLEDLWCFNEESVARAAFQAKTPIISAVGHEIDFTILDFVADMRAATPSQAAELAVFSYDEAMRLLDESRNRLSLAVWSRLDHEKLSLSEKSQTLLRFHPKNILTENQQKLSDCKRDIRHAIENMFSKKNQDYLILAEKLSGLSPLKSLKNGYGYLTKDETPIHSYKEVKKGDSICITLHDGKIDALVTDTEEEII